MFWLEKCFTMFWLEKLNKQRPNNAFLGQLIGFFWQKNIIGEQKYSLKKNLRKKKFYNILAWKIIFTMFWLEKYFYNVLAWKFQLRFWLPGQSVAYFDKKKLFSGTKNIHKKTFWEKKNFTMFWLEKYFYNVLAWKVIK